MDGAYVPQIVHLLDDYKNLLAWEWIVHPLHIE